MNKLTLILALVCVTLSAQAQMSRIDSLYAKAHTSGGMAEQGMYVPHSERVKILKQLNRERLLRLRLPLKYETKKQPRCNEVAKGLTKSFKHRVGDYRAETITITTGPDGVIGAFMDSKPHKKALMSFWARRACIGVYRYDRLDLRDPNNVKYDGGYYAVIRTY